MGQWYKCFAIGKISSSSVHKFPFDIWTKDFVTGLPLDGSLNGLMVFCWEAYLAFLLDPLFCGEGALMAP